MRKLGLLFLRILPALLVMGLILYLSSQTGDHLRRFQRYDKIFHALAYGTLAVSILFAFQPLRKRISCLWLAFAAVGFCVGFGILDEWFQSHIPRRIVDSRDVIADTLGAVLVVSFWLLKSFRF